MSHQQKKVELEWDKWEKSRDLDAGNFLVNEYRSLVNYHVQRMQVRVPKTVTQDELTSLGLQGLFDALTKFDRSRKLKFETYASFRIRGAIIDGLRKADWLSRSSRDKTKRLEEAVELLVQQVQRHPTDEEIAHLLSWSIEEVHEVRQEKYVGTILSIDEKIQSDDDETEQLYFLEDDSSETPEQHVVKEELLEDMIEQIKLLNENEQTVLQLFYSNEMTLTEIGQILNLSTSRISQIHSKALKKLKNNLSIEVIDGGIL